MLSVLLVAGVVYGDRGGSCPDALAPTCTCPDGTIVPPRSKRDAHKKPCASGRPTCLCTDGSAPVKEEREEGRHHSPCADKAEPVCSGNSLFLNIRGFNQCKCSKFRTVPEIKS